MAYFIPALYAHKTAGSIATNFVNCIFKIHLESFWDRVPHDTRRYSPALVRWVAVTRTLHWRHNQRNSVSNHRRLDCLLNILFRRRSKKTSKLSVTGICEGNSPVTGEFPAERARDAKNVSLLMTSSWSFDMVPCINPSNGLPCQTHITSNHLTRNDISNV